MGPRPFFGMLEVTRGCNSRCVYCSCWRIRDPEGPDVETCWRTIADMAALGVRRLTLTGGEPLLRSDLEEIVRAGLEHQLYTTIVTNGLLLNRRRLEALIAAGLHSLTLSIDSLSDDIYQQHRGISLKPAQRALDLALEYHRSQAVSVSLNCVLTALNYGEVGNLLDFAAANELGLLVQPCNTDSRTELNYLIPGPDQTAACRTALRNLANRKEAGAPLINSRQFLEKTEQYWLDGGRVNAADCCYGDVTVTVRANGDVTPCWRLPAVGNVREQHLTDIWAGATFAAVRRQMHAGDCPGCLLACSFDWETLHHSEERIERFWAGYNRRNGRGERDQGESL